MAHGVGTNAERLATPGISARLFPEFQPHRATLAMDENGIHPQPMLGIKGRLETASAEPPEGYAQARGRLAKSDEKRKRVLPGNMCLLPNPF